MAITEESRNRLRTYLEETIGEEQASAMMDHLLPVGWTDLATHAEVDALRADMTREFAAVRAEFACLREVMDLRWENTATKVELADLRVEMHQGFRRQTLAIITATAAFDGLMLAAMRLT